MKKIKRKGSGRKKGQLCKAFESGQPLAEILRLAERGGYRKDVLRVYDHLRTLAWQQDFLIRSGLDVQNKRRATYEHFVGYLSENGSPEVFQALWVLINAVRKKDIQFFNELARTFEAMVKKDAAPTTLFTPPADPEFYWLGKLREQFENTPLNKRQPFTLNQIGKFLKEHIGYRPSDSSLSAKAKRVGIAVHLRFGKNR